MSDCEALQKIVEAQIQQANVTSELITQCHSMAETIKDTLELVEELHKRIEHIEAFLNI